MCFKKKDSNLSLDTSTKYDEIIVMKKKIEQVIKAMEHYSNAKSRADEVAKTLTSLAPLMGHVVGAEEETYAQSVSDAFRDLEGLQKTFRERVSYNSIGTMRKYVDDTQGLICQMKQINKIKKGMQKSANPEQTQSIYDKEMASFHDALAANEKAAKDVDKAIREFVSATEDRMGNALGCLEKLEKKTASLEKGKPKQPGKPVTKDPKSVDKPKPDNPKQSAGATGKGAKSPFDEGKSESQHSQDQDDGEIEYPCGFGHPFIE